MFSYFSVKKPYTVIVGVIMILMLGVISFTKSTTDLLPEMELPYVIVYSTYPGASAEKVESSLTRVLESSISTTENLANISSISSDNLSLIILEFEEETNMDTAMIDLNAKIDLVEGYLDEMVSTPTLMAINPNMLPIMMATVDDDNKDLYELSDFVDEKIVIELEKISGVASVDASGLLEESVHILFNQEKIDEINNKMLASVNSELAKAEREIRDGLKEVNDGLQKIQDGESELQDAKEESIEQLAEATVQLQQAATNLIAMDSQLTQLNAEKMAFTQAKSAIEEGLKQMGTMLQGAGVIADTETETILQYIDEFYLNYETQMNGIDAYIAALSQVRSALDAQMSAGTLPADEIVSETALAAMIGEELVGALVNEGIQFGTLTYQDLITQLDTITASTEFKKNSLVQMKTMLDAAGGNQLSRQYDDILTKINNVEIELATAEGVKQAASSMLTQAGFDVNDLNKLQTDLESGKIIATSELTKGEMTLNSTKSTLEQTKAQLESALDELKTARDEALKTADLSGVLTPAMISGILTAENFSMPAGYIASDDASLLLKVGEEFASLEEVENLLILSLDIKGLEEVYLKDLAEIRIIDNSDELYTKVNGNDGVMISFQKTSTASTAEVCKAINQRFEELEAEYEGLHFNALMDQGVYIDMIIQSVLENFALGGVLAIIILILFLKDIKPTIIIGLSIPISLMFSLVLMYFSDVTLNIISLSGLALGVGMLVDNSVVVVENIYRMRSEGVGLIKASVEGAKEVSGALVASTLTTVCVFLPIVFAEGLAKQLFVDMGLTIAYSLLASLAVALTLVPMLSSRILKKPSKAKYRLFDAMTNGYVRLLDWTLRHKLPMLLGTGALLVLAVVLTFSMPMTLIPEMNSGQMTLSVSLLDEEATQDEAYQIYDEVMDRVKDLDGIDAIGVTGQGSGVTSMMSSSNGLSTTFYIITEKDADLTRLETEIKDSVVSLPIKASVSGSNMDLSALGGSGITIYLYGNDLDDLQSASEQLAAQLEQMEGIEESKTSNEDPTQELRVIVDKNAAMEYGLTVAQVFQTLSSGAVKETSSTTLQIEGKEYPVIIIHDESSLITTDSLESTVLKGTKGKDEVEVELNEIASIVEGTGMASIHRDNSRRYMTVSASIAEGYNVSLVSRDVNEKLDLSSLPKGVDIEFAGENETIMETMVTMLQMIALAIAFIYMIMVAQFQSLVSPFIVMFTIPLAFTGGLLGLVLTNQPISIVSMLGFLVLCGVVVNNGIVFIDYANQLRIGGMDCRQAMLVTGKTRLRPILMTALTTILAMIPMAYGVGEGAEMMQGMAIVTIGGLTYATLLTLFIVPVMIELFTGKKKMIDIDQAIEMGE